MSDLLKQITSVLPEAQKQAIKSLIDRKKKTGETPSYRSQQDEINNLYKRIKDKLGKKLLNPRYATSEEKISSTSHNQNMEEIYLDLNALYSNIDSIGKLNKQQGVLLTSEYEKSKAAIYKLLNDVSVFAIRKKYPEYNDVKVIDFNINSNTNTKAPVAAITSNTRLLELKPVNYSRAHLTDRGNRFTKVYTKTYAKGIKGSLSKSFPPDQMVDQKPETFWGTLVMSNIPITQVYQINNDNQTTGIDVDGPVTEVYLQFSNVEQINTIKYLPFSEYPVQILDVSYKTSPSSLVYRTVQDFRTSTTLDWEELNFETIYAHEIRIIIAQSNYKKVIYHLPRTAAVGTDLFQQIFNKKTEGTIDDGLVPDSDALLQILKTTSTYNDALTLLQSVFNVSDLDITLQTDTKYYTDVLNVINEVYASIDPNITDKLSSIGQALATVQDEIIEINKYEYILGMREVEAGHILYAPVSYYKSELYDTQATVSEVAVEVDERHSTFTTPWESGYQKTSTEWEIDIGNNRRIAIHPKNITDAIDGIPAVKDERLWFYQGQNYALTRLGGYYAGVYRLKKDGNLLPSTDYTVTKITGSTPRLQITLSSGWVDNSVYTVDYAVDPESYNLQILDKFHSIPLSSPEVFTSVGSDNEVSLSKYPFINYEVINLSNHFTQDSTDNSWLFTPALSNINSGQLRLTPTIIDDAGNILQTGLTDAYTMTGVWGTRSGQSEVDLTGLNSSYFGSIGGVNFGYFIKVMDSLNYSEVYQFANHWEMLLTTPPTVTLNQVQRWDANQTGVVFVGSLTGTPSGYLQVDYTLGIGIKTDDQVFTLSENRYSPITIHVGGILAKNITNYTTLEHPSFSIATRKDNEYQYIHAGKRIYFNQPIVGKEIKIQYNWVTDSISLIGTLRCNKLSNPDLNPKLNSARILINNLII